MTTVTRRTFTQSLNYGVNLNDPKLSDSLPGTGVTVRQLRQLDANSDGRLQGRSELGQVFRQVDRLDRDGSGRSFQTRGRAGKLYSALLDARRPGPYHGLAVAKVAISLVASRGEQYAREAAPVSENPKLSHNASPGRTPLTWLAGRYKCNQFVGDALWRAGMKAPSYAMPDGGVHYVNAEALPGQPCFDRLARLEDLRLGDLIVVDVPGRGADSAHAEIVTHLDRRRGIIRTTGAHADGAYESSGSTLLGGQTWSTALHKATYDDKNQRWHLNDLQIYLLRPTRSRP